MTNGEVEKDNSVNENPDLARVTSGSERQPNGLPMCPFCGAEAKEAARKHWIHIAHTSTCFISLLAQQDMYIPRDHWLDAWATRTAILPAKQVCIDCGHRDQRDELRGRCQNVTEVEGSLVYCGHRCDTFQNGSEDVGAALAELREMFARQGQFPPYITAGFNPNNEGQHLFVAHLVAQGVGQHFEGVTLAEAMMKVKEWKQNQ